MINVEGCVEVPPSLPGFVDGQAATITAAQGAQVYQLPAAVEKGVVRAIAGRSGIPCHLPRIVEAGAISSIPAQGAQVRYLPVAGEQVPNGQDLAIVIDGCSPKQSNAQCRIY